MAKAEILTTLEVNAAELKKLMHDRNFLVDVAIACDQAYRLAEIVKLEGQGQDVPAYLLADLFTGEEKILFCAEMDDRISPETRKKYAQNIASLYGVIDALPYLCGMNTATQDSVLQAIVNDSLDLLSKNLLLTFIHTAWAASQPAIDSGRETREVMGPFVSLPKVEQDKDMVQAQAIARVFRDYLSR